MIDLVKTVSEDVVHVYVLRMTRIGHPVVAHEYDVHDICEITSSQRIVDIFSELVNFA